MNPRSFLPPALFLGLLLSSAPALAFEAGVAPATRKILPATPTPTEQAATLSAARNEWEGFQIVVRHDAPLSSVNASVSDLTGEGGAVIAASNVRLYREHYLNVTNESPGGALYHERAVGLYPDPLIPFSDPYSAVPKPIGAPFDLAAGETGTIFADVYVPLGTPPGLHQGTATLTAQGQDSVEFPVSLTVWEYDIPLERTLGTAFGFSYGAMRKHHGGPEGPDAETEAEIVGRYIEALHEHRMDPTDIPADIEFAFDGQGNLIPPDWTAYDAALEPWLTGSKFADGQPVARFNVGRFEPGHGLGSMTEEQYSQASAALAEHLEEKGWWDKAYVYAADEPWLNGGDEAYERIRHESGLLFKYSDLWRGHILVTSPFKTEIENEIGIWCPVTPMYDDWWWLDGSCAGRGDYDALFARGVKLWFYVCNANLPPYAGYDIDSAIGYEPRIVKWGTWFEQASGFLYWRTTYWTDDDPWNVFLNLPEFGETFARDGDGLLIYPGNHDGAAGGKGSPVGVAINGPVVSYRMKQIRDGFEDWELFRLAEDLGAGPYAREQVGRAYTRFGDFFVVDCDIEHAYCPERQPWTLDESLLQEVRANVALKVQYLLNPEKYSDPEALPDGDADGDAEAEAEPQASDGDEETAAPQDKSNGSGGCASASDGAAGWLGLLLGALALAAGRRRMGSCGE